MPPGLRTRRLCWRGWTPRPCARTSRSATPVSVDTPVQRPKLIDPFLPKIEELVEQSEAAVRADVLHERLAAMGFSGDERTTRRAVAIAKQAWREGHRRQYRPWITEPGLWLQFDWGHGPRASRVRS
jgi:hypothetical protein